MDGRGRLAESLMDGFARARRRAVDLAVGWQRLLRRWLKPVLELDLPQGVGTAASTAFFIAVGVFGVVRGDQVGRLTQELKVARDGISNAFGFRITAVSLTGQYQLTEEEILEAIGVHARSSLLFLDAAAARDALKANPWVADATVQKLYPGHLLVSITERDPFALWQKDGKVSVISDTGVVLETVVAPQFVALPLVVGAGAETRAKDFLALIDKYPKLRDQVRASVLVAERRWNLMLKNGVEVKLPELEVAHALDALVELDRDKKLLTRDIELIDLRLPDRVTVRLTEEAAQAHEEELRAREIEHEKSRKRKGGAA
jgi:cell division protein FtsQ